MKLTERESKMLTRLKRAGKLHWILISTEDARTLNRLVKKGAAQQVVGLERSVAWEPVKAQPRS